MSTQQRTLSWTGTTPVALAEKKLILPLLTITKVNCAKKIQIRHAWYFFERVFRLKKLILWRVKCKNPTKIDLPVVDYESK